MLERKEFWCTGRKRGDPVVAWVEPDAAVGVMKPLALLGPSARWFSGLTQIKGVGNGFTNIKSLGKLARALVTVEGFRGICTCLRYRPIFPGRARATKLEDSIINGQCSKTVTASTVH